MTTPHPEMTRSLRSEPCGKIPLSRSGILNDGQKKKLDSMLQENEQHMHPQGEAAPGTNPPSAPHRLLAQCHPQVPIRLPAARRPRAKRGWFSKGIPSVAGCLCILLIFLRDTKGPCGAPDNQLPNRVPGVYSEAPETCMQICRRVFRSVAIIVVFVSSLSFSAAAGIRGSKSRCLPATNNR